MKFLNKANTRKQFPQLKTKRDFIDYCIEQKAYVYECTKDGDKKRSFAISMGFFFEKITKTEFLYAKSKIDYKVNLVNPKLRLQESRV